MLKFRKSDRLPEVALTVTTETFIRLALLTVGAVLLVAAVHKAAHAVLLIFIALFLALALNAPVHWLGQRLPGKKRGSRALATGLSFLVVILLIGGFVAATAAPLIRQTDDFVGAAPHLLRDFRGQDSQTGRFIRTHHLEKQIDTVSRQLSERLKHAGGAAFSTVQRVGTSVFSLLTIIVLTFMMLVEGPRWLDFGRELTPRRHLSATERIAGEMYDVVKGYVNGQVLLAALAALLIMPAILLLHISYPVALLVIVFFCGLIPMVGHTIGAIIVTVVALFHSTSAAIIILTYYILYQQMENYLLQPRIQANSTNMSPLLVFMAVVVGVSFGGLIGGLVAIPIAGCLRIAVLEYLRHVKLINDATYKEALEDTK